jgi:hypothetical protein
MTLRTKTLSICAASALAFLGVGASATTAQAETLSQSCISSTTLNFSPGIALLQSQQITVSGTGSLTGCLSQAGASGLASTNVTYTGTLSGSCLFATADITQTIQWNNGATSVVEFDTGVQSALLLNALVGQVTSGLFAGNTVVLPNAITSTLANPTACGAPGGLKQSQSAGDEVFTSIL